MDTTDTTEVQLYKKVSSLITQIQNFEDIHSLHQKIGDGLSIVGDASTLISITKGIYLLYEKSKFEAFLVQLYFKLHEKQTIDPADALILNDFLKNERNVKFIAESIDACFHSHSVKCSAILGFFVGCIISKKREIGYSDLIIINSLRIMLDNDLENFMLLYKYVKEHSDLPFHANHHTIHISQVLKQYTDCPIPSFEMEMTVEKMKKVQVIGYDIGGMFGSGDAWGVFIFNRTSDYLYNTIVKFQHSE